MAKLLFQAKAHRIGQGYASELLSALGEVSSTELPPAQLLIEPLTLRELEVLKYLIAHEGQVVTREDLLDKVWGYEEFPTTRTVDNYILSLRKKLEPVPGSPVHILTVYTAGYKFVR